MGKRGRSLPVFDHFEFDDCNTICDATGFKVKLSETVERWDGYRVIEDYDEPRQPQDFPATPREPRVYKEARFESEEVFTAYTPPTNEELSQK